MRLHDRYGQPVRKRIKNFRRASQQRLDGSRMAMVWVDPRYFVNGEGFPSSLVEGLDISDYSVQELKDYMDLNSIDRTGLTLKFDLVDAIAAYYA